MTTETPEAPAETTEETVVVPDESQLNNLAQLVLATYREQVAEYNSRQATLDAATGDRSKAVHELRNSSDDPAVVKFRAWLEKFDKQREDAITKIDAHISENLLPQSDMSEEDQTKEKEALKELRAEIKEGEKYFLKLPAVKTLENAENLLPKVSGARKSVSTGTGTGSPKPRITGAYLDGKLCSHDVVKDGKTIVKSTFTDLVKALSDANKVKVETSDIHKAYLEAAKTDDWNAAPDKVEFGYHVTSKDGVSNNYTILITK